jgi:hypothetical protein
MFWSHIQFYFLNLSRLNAFSQGIITASLICFPILSLRFLFTAMDGEATMWEGQLVTERNITDFNNNLI